MIKGIQMIGSLEAGGIQAFAVNLCRALDANKVYFDFAIDHVDHEFYKPIIHDLGRELIVMPTPTYTNTRSYAKAWDAFFESHPEYSIIHGHARSTASLYLRSAKRHGLATVAHSHNTSNGKGLRARAKDLTGKSIWKYADCLLACSEDAGSWLFGKHWRNDRPSYLVSNGIDAHRFDFSDERWANVRRELGISNDSFVVGHVGRFSYVKNQRFLVSVFAEFLERHNNAVLLLLGDGDLRPEIERQVDGLGLHEKVIFAGTAANPAPYYSAMDVFAFPSIYEGIPLALVEAQAAGLPILASSSIDGAAFLSKESATSIPPEDVALWVENLNAICERGETHGRINRVLDTSYDISRTARQMEKLYANLVAGRGVKANSQIFQMM